LVVSKGYILTCCNNLIYFSVKLCVFLSMIFQNIDDRKRNIIAIIIIIIIIINKLSTWLGVNTA